jgi:hypothetical protein
MLSSQTPPVPYPGHTLSFCIHKFTSKSINGYTHEIYIVSESEGYFKVVPARSASSKDMFEAVREFIASMY